MKDNKIALWKDLCSSLQLPYIRRIVKFLIMEPSKKIIFDYKNLTL